MPIWLPGFSIELGLLKTKNELDKLGHPSFLPPFLELLAESFVQHLSWNALQDWCMPMHVDELTQDHSFVRPSEV